MCNSIMVFPFNSLSSELQLLVLEELDLSDLTLACRLNRAISFEATRLLWGVIDFQDDEHAYDEELLARMRKFFTICRELHQDRPKRWAEISQHIQVLRMIHLEGMRIPDEEKPANPEFFDWTLLSCKSHYPCILDLAIDCRNLKCLHVYARNSCDKFGYSNKNIENAKKGMPCLEELVIGGEMDTEFVQGMLSSPQQIRTLKVLQLLDGSCGQENHSGGMILYGQIAPKFENLTTLHLRKIAAIKEGEAFHDFVGLQWDFDIENDIAVLEDWAALISHVSNTLENLTLEDAYLIDGDTYFETMEELEAARETGDPGELGRGSRKRFAQYLLPALEKQAWPKLEYLRLMGVVTVKDVDPLCDSLRPGVEVDIDPGSLVKFDYSTTPLIVSPPGSPFSN